MAMFNPSNSLAGMGSVKGSSAPEPGGGSLASFGRDPVEEERRRRALLAKQSEKDATAKQAGAGVGTGLGTILGALIGSLIPGAGTAAGAALGAGISSLMAAGGAAAGGAIGDAAVEDPDLTPPKAPMNFALQGR